MQAHPSPLAGADTVTATVAAIPVLTQTTVVIIFGFIVARMTARAIRLIGWCRPDDSLGVAGVTSCTT
jgi:hypothetical protein